MVETETVYSVSSIYRESGWRNLMFSFSRLKLKTEKMDSRPTRTHVVGTFRSTMSGQFILIISGEVSCETL